ncbi:MAG TPA: hypothetical protein VH723_00135 [Candidatus Limnocylindrales bacterium]|jgi:hypothetical protein
MDDMRAGGATAPDRRVTAAIGVLLIVFGGAWLLGRAAGIDVGRVGWPLIVIGVGAALFIVGTVMGGRGGVGPATAGGIVTMVGAVLAAQNATGLWATWAYAWALVAPGGAGLGMLAYGLIARQPDFVENGRSMLLTGLGLFAGFFLFFEGVIGISGRRILSDELFPIVLVGVGGLLIVLSLFGRRRTNA